MRLFLGFLLCFSAQAQPRITDIQCTDAASMWRVYSYCDETLLGWLEIRGPHVIASGPADRSVDLSWTSEPGKSYSVEASGIIDCWCLPTVLADCWQPISLPIVATGDLTRWSGGAPDGVRFFRIRLLDTP